MNISATVSTPAAQMPHVLLAEDDDDLRETLQRYLEVSGCKVTALEDGLELGDYLTLAQNDERRVAPLNLILTDIYMPGMNALDVLEQIGKAERCPVVLISGAATDATRARAARAGITLVLDKPIDPLVLSSVVVALLAGKSP